jgi:hypothetical protein
LAAIESDVDNYISHRGRQEEFFLSRHVGIVPLDASHVIVTHALGRRKVIGGPNLKAELARFEMPRRADAEGESADGIAPRFDHPALRFG